MNCTGRGVVRAPVWWSLIVVLCVGLPGSGCVLRALAIGGADGKGLHTSNSGEGSAPTYDCWPSVFGAGSTCRPRAAPAPAPRRVLAAARGEEPWQRRDGRLQTRANFPGGQLVVRGQPDRHQAEALLMIRSTRRLDPAPCQVRMFRDGVQLPLHEVQRASDFEVRVTIEAHALRQLQDSVRFAGEVCGRRFELDRAARETLSLFEARFHEERSRLQPSLAASP